MRGLVAPNEPASKGTPNRGHEALCLILKRDWRGASEGCYTGLMRTRRWFTFLSLSVWASLAVAQPEPGGADLSTPKRALRTFIVAAREGDYGRAARVLDLSGVPIDERAAEGPTLARELKSVLDQELWIDFSRVPDDPESDRVTVGTIGVDGRHVPVELVGSGAVWHIGRRTVDAIPALYAAHGPSWIESMLPRWLSKRVWEMALWQWLGLLGALILAYASGALIAAFAMRLGGRFATRTETRWDDRLLALLRGPTRFLVAILLGWVLIRGLHLAAPAQEAVDKILLIGLIGALAWYANRLVRLVADRVEEHGRERAERAELDDIALRGLRTQVAVLRRVASIVVGVVAVSMMLVQFDVVRTVGMSLLASAGIAGVVLGLAAQRSIATLLAGLQLSVTQPIRIGDTVIVEGEWGTIEEINLTYVVVNVWDQRRLVVPMSRFLEQPFQNWTKVSPELLGTIFLYADYRLPMDAVRAELDRILDGNPKWDGRVKSVLVTDATDRSIQVRALISAANASDQWDLRCEVREKLIAFLRELEGGRYLPRTRVEPEPSAELGAA